MAVTILASLTKGNQTIRDSVVTVVIEVKCTCLTPSLWVGVVLLLQPSRGHCSWLSRVEYQQGHTLNSALSKGKLTVQYIPASWFCIGKGQHDQIENRKEMLQISY